jgi:hypothetical protein
MRLNAVFNLFVNLGDRFGQHLFDELNIAIANHL